MYRCQPLFTRRGFARGGAGATTLTIGTALAALAGTSLPEALSEPVPAPGEEVPTAFQAALHRLYPGAMIGMKGSLGGKLPGGKATWCRPSRRSSAAEW